MIKRVSEVVAEIGACPYPKEKFLPIVWCIIEEVPAEQWGVGGQGVELEALKQLLDGQAKENFTIIDGSPWLVH